MAEDIKVMRTIYSAIDDVNLLLADSGRLEKIADTVLFGSESMLDSMGFVNLVVSIERRVEKDYGITINLINEDVLSQGYAPLKTIGTLASYLLNTIEGRMNG